MLRKICFEWSAGGYNSEGLMPPDVADAKIRWIIDDTRHAALARAPLPAKGDRPEPEPMTIDQSKQYLIGFMEQHFKDKTFHRYIRGGLDRATLAGDFAWELARTLRMLSAAPAQAADPLESMNTLRAEVREMKNHLETFGPYAEETARVAIDGVLDVIDEHIAAMSASQDQNGGAA
jgi:plasmid maintenance system killer protein